VESSPISESEEGGVEPWSLKFLNDDSNENNNNSSSISNVAQELGVTQDFLIQLKENWEKAIESEKERSKENQNLRQGGDSLGEFFGLGPGGGAGSPGGFGFGGGQGGDEEDDDEEGPP
jgi:hypothetical protein